MIAPRIGDGKSLIPAGKVEETTKNALGSITNTLKEP
jgi:hypothetical protein